MQRIFRGIVTAIGALLLIVTLLFAYVRLRGPTHEQREALALLEERAVPVGRNAFAALWLMPYRVPDAESESVADDSVRRLARRPPVSQAQPPGESLQDAVPKRYARIPQPRDDATGLCRAEGPACLQTVRASLEQARVLVAEHAELVERLRRLSRYGHFHNRFPIRPDVPLPVTVSQSILETALALEFVNGQRESALAAACSNLALWRRLVPGSDTLIMSMVAVANARRAALLLSEMLAETPTTFALPGACDAALAAPLPRESLICAAMQGEFRYSQHMFGQAMTPPGAKPGSGLAHRITFDRDMTAAVVSPAYAWSCSAAARRTVAADVRATLPRVSPYALETLGNATGQLLASITIPALDEYLHRAQDHGARMRLLAVVAWMRAHNDDRPVSARLAEVPPDLLSATRPIEVTNNGASLRVRQFSGRYGEYFSLPLAGADPRVDSP